MSTPPPGPAPAATPPPSRLAAEIASQPDEVARFLDRAEPEARRIVAALPPFGWALVAARGSSDHAGTYARYLWGHLAAIPVASAAPSLGTIYGTPPRLEGALVVGLSQSGQSPDIVAVVEEGRRQGRPTLAITNDPASPLAGAADFVLPLGLTPERSIAATRTYTGTLAAVALLGALLPGAESAPPRLDALRRIPDAMARALADADEPCARVAARLRDAGTLLVVARGLNLCTAEEIALKLREILRVATHPFSAADLRHGSIALATSGMPAVVVMPRGGPFADLHAIAAELEARGALVVPISDAADLPGAAARLPTPSVPEWLSPLVAVLPAQRLALALAAARGVDPDRPQGLAEKVVRTL